MTLREFLLKNVPRDEIRRRQCREEWIAAVDRLLAQLRTWLTDAGSAELLDLEPLEFERREQGLGAYHIKGLAINFGERTVKVVPVGRMVLAHLGPYAEAGHEKASPPPGPVYPQADVARGKAPGFSFPDASFGLSWMAARIVNHQSGGRDRCPRQPRRRIA